VNSHSIYIICGESVQRDLDKLSWGIIGFGEAGSAFAVHIVQRLGHPIHVVDPLLNRSPLPDHLRERLDRVAVEVVPDIASLVHRCDVVLSLVTPRLASPVAQEAASAWDHGLYVDFNSVSPLEKQRVAADFPADSYVDGSILGSVATEGPATPIALGGGRAPEARSYLTSVELKASVVGTEVGAASALKMCRSIFMKGLECLFVETLLAADQFGVTQPVLTSIEDTVKSYGLRPLCQMLVTTHATHCLRRSEEMQEATRMLEEAGIPYRMSQGARDFLEASYRSGVTDHFNHRVPDRFDEVIAYFRSYYEAKK
jgi:3-hydroxyisobutyrate dehydrogenase-like beta-hydroxyacid dehydrogenase